MNEYEKIVAERAKLFESYNQLILEELNRQRDKWDALLHKSNGVITQHLSAALGNWNQALLDGSIEQAKKEILQVMIIAYVFVQERLDEEESGHFQKTILRVFVFAFSLRFDILPQTSLCPHTGQTIGFHETMALRLLEKAGHWAYCTRFIEMKPFAISSLQDLIIESMLWLHHATHSSFDK